MTSLVSIAVEEGAAVLPVTAPSDEVRGINDRAQLAEAEAQLMGEFHREYKLKTALAEIQDQYEVIIIDCPPSLGVLTMNALLAANEVIIPVEPGVFPLVGIQYLHSTIGKIQRVNQELRITGVLPTMVDRTVLARETRERLVQTYGDVVLPDIPRRVVIGEAHAAGQDRHISVPEQLQGPENALEHFPDWNQIYKTALPEEPYPTSYITEQSLAWPDDAARTD